MILVSLISNSLIIRDLSLSYDEVHKKVELNGVMGTE